MPNRIAKNTDAPDHDSFLDIVANIVGILIILVMVMGVRVKNMPVVAAIPATEDSQDKELKRDQAEVASVRSDVLAIHEQKKNTERETLIQKRRRNLLATAVAAAKHEIDERRRELDADARAESELRQQLSESKFHLEQVQRRLASAETARVEPSAIENRPTPLSRTVHGREVHFQLRAGRVVRVPLAELMERVAVDLRLKASKVFNPEKLGGTVGPLDGFRARYSVTRASQLFEFIPVSRDLGETTDEALADGSPFRRTLSQLPPDRTTVTLWTYEDSFGSFQRLKKELYDLGFQVAARPLPHGVHVSGSSRGNKSSAQ